MAVETAFQAALATALAGIGLSVRDVGVQAADGGAAGPFPYCEVGYTDLQDFDTTTKNGFDVLTRVHTWSRSAGMKETKDTQGAIYAALHNATLTVSGHRVTLLRRLRSTVLREPDGTFHGVCEYRALIETT